MLATLSCSLLLLTIQAGGPQREGAQREFSRTAREENRARLLLWHAYAAYEDFVQALREPTRGAELRAALAAWNAAAARALAGGESRSAALATWTSHALEHGISRSVSTSLATPLLRVAASALRANPPRDPGDATLEALDKLVPAGMPFAEIWNRSLVPLVPEAREYQRAREAREKARRDLLAVIHPARLHPAWRKTPPGMTLVPGGLYSLGPAKGWVSGEAARLRTVKIRTFYIDIDEVTNREFRRFLGAIPKRRAQPLYPSTWIASSEGGTPSIPAGEEDHPVTGIDLVAAWSYAQWSDKRLPTEEEWEIAARGPSASLYTWGEEYQRNAANGSDSDRFATAPVGSHPSDRSFFGCNDMCGNVAEWTISLPEGKALRRLPAEDAIVNVICRGGSFLSAEPVESLSLVYRWPQPASGTRRSDLGFRCAKDAPR